MINLSFVWAPLCIDTPLLEPFHYQGKNYSTAQENPR